MLKLVKSFPASMPEDHRSRLSMIPFPDESTYAPRRSALLGESATGAKGLSWWRFGILTIQVACTTSHTLMSVATVTTSVMTAMDQVRVTMVRVCRFCSRR